MKTSDASAASVPPRQVPWSAFLADLDTASSAPYFPVTSVGMSVPQRTLSVAVERRARILAPLDPRAFYIFMFSSLLSSVWSRSRVHVSSQAPKVRSPSRNLFSSICGADFLLSSASGRSVPSSVDFSLPTHLKRAAEDQVETARQFESYDSGFSRWGIRFSFLLTELGPTSQLTIWPAISVDICVSQWIYASLTGSPGVLRDVQQRATTFGESVHRLEEPVHDSLLTDAYSSASMLTAADSRPTHPFCPRRPLFQCFPRKCEDFRRFNMLYARSAFLVHQADFNRTMFFPSSSVHREDKQRTPEYRTTSPRPSRCAVWRTNFRLV
ncbi:hypothetical protein HYPSUDRAFT_422208 [Hypholoma sublateritium FD-334 SS-4]|uniref:Uncharacterized protein n=1 Tax=Hypholoma sublateritium (strain FD-334 SS-4) TaxID=945553 RepID=A0A0D2Q1A3_HYPSF|nr:hypothetical protein HYPSUDRAFT_422208 [Hypholoma sublateritium FD-334 SS-4]